MDEERARRSRNLIIAALVIAALIWAGVLFKMAIGQPQRVAPTSRAELRQVLAGAGDVAEACTGPTLYDTYGTIQDLSWLESTYGAVGWQCAEVHPDADYIYRLTELRASCGPAVIVANVKDEWGGPLADRAVVRYWPGAPALAFYDPPASRWTDLGVVGWTGANGDVGFGLGAGDYYWPDSGSGVTQMYVADYDGPADMVTGLGMIAATDHCTLFPVWFRIPKEDVVPPPTATPGPVTPSPLTPSPNPLPEGEGFYRIEGMWLQLATPAP